MAKYRKFNRTDLTPIQKQERARRLMMRDRILFGMPTPKGNKLRKYDPTGEPILKPMPRPGPTSLDWLWGFITLLPWMRRRRREAELAKEQRSQAIKVKGIK